MTSCYLFSYGTLRRPEVQEAVFGRTLPAYPDSVLDHRVGTVRITDPAVIATSGSEVHPVLEPAPGAHVDGDALAVTEADLPAADAYEVDDYVRVQIVLASGRTAWAYLASTVAPESVASGAN